MVDSIANMNHDGRSTLKIGYLFLLSRDWRYQLQWMQRMSKLTNLKDSIPIPMRYYTWYIQPGDVAYSNTSLPGTDRQMPEYIWSAIIHTPHSARNVTFNRLQMNGWQSMAFHTQSLSAFAVYASLHSCYSTAASQQKWKEVHGSSTGSYRCLSQRRLGKWST
jgi:hypothetical protein